MNVSNITRLPYIILFFFFNDTATTEIYTLSLHDALPICPLWSVPQGLSRQSGACAGCAARPARTPLARRERCAGDRKSTRLNSSHLVISYAVFCLKKKTYYFRTRWSPRTDWLARPARSVVVVVLYVDP